MLQELDHLPLVPLFPLHPSSMCRLLPARAFGNKECHLWVPRGIYIVAFLPMPWRTRQDPNPMIEALRRRHLEPEALFLVGETHASNRETLARISGARRIYEVPHFESVQRETLEGWLADQDLSELFSD